MTVHCSTQNCRSFLNNFDNDIIQYEYILADSNCDYLIRLGQNLDQSKKWVQTSTAASEVAPDFQTICFMVWSHQLTVTDEACFSEVLKSQLKDIQCYRVDSESKTPDDQVWGLGLTYDHRSLEVED